MMPSRYCIRYVSTSERPCSGHRTGKDQSSPQFPRRVALNIGQLHSSPTLVRSCLNSCMLGFSLMLTKNFQAEFRKGRGTRDQIANIHWIIEKKLGHSRKTSTSVSATILKPLTMWIITNWKALKEMGIPDHLTCLLRNNS